MRFVTVAISALVTMASAYTQPDYSKAPQGNAILKPGLNEQVPVGKPYTITWDPTTQGPVSLVLLRGPSTNVVPLSTIVESIPNTGSYSWTPSTDLENDVTHYGLLLVVEGTGQYQWSTQFGISNPEEAADTPAASVETPAVSAPAGSDVTIITTETTTWCPESTAKPTSIPVIVPTGGPSIPSGSPTPSAYPSSTLISKTYSPSSPSGTTPTPSLFTGAADRTAVSVGAVAAGVLAVLAF
ncbi:GPI anchored serine-threonine rich protein [Aspergillus novofumigatus IBT 16806]|uniref:GPI anchored serine-threonine rich protein n=1 Tax=Aspergillus novofumigatus (strain IBT 16806) TaxID=1392255 RepID=A0A2I1BWB8_ASPN1|nr:GPI anchored serine-threonine rich protein [Aspergillus novofumigatus IBT 16806]PKX89591.1 GPI anchored serine-threonine rich protein [Aspergillus novofumigatus IBT 16806]